MHAPASAFLDAEVRRTLGRISRIFPDLDGEALRSSLRSIEHAIWRLARSEAADLLTSLSDAAAVARRALPDDDTSFVWGPLGSGITANPAKTLASLYTRFVARYDERHSSHRDDAAVWKPVRDRLADLHLADRLQPKTIASRIDRVEFEHAWKNGAWHCYQPLSFDLANEDTIRDKARRWAGQMLALSDPTEPFKPYFIVGSPGTEALKSAYGAALDILRLSPGSPEIIEEHDVDQLVHGTGRLIQDSDGVA
ncbi:MAG: DUF3037 domain-containing protein [Stellaceae bacterium]